MPDQVLACAHPWHLQEWFMLLAAMGYFPTVFWLVGKKLLDYYQALRVRLIKEALEAAEPEQEKMMVM